MATLRGLARQIGGDLFGGTLAGVYTLVFSFTYGTLIFSGALQAARPLGIAMVLTATVVLLIVTVLLSALPFELNVPDGTTTALLAVFAAGIAGRMGTADPTALTATLHAGVALATIVIGLFMAVLGLCRAGQVVRYVPYPVIAGFFAAGGLFLVEGGIRVGTQIDPMSLDIGGFLSPVAAIQLAATLLTFLVMLAVVPRMHTPAALPMVMLAACVVHHLAFAAAGLDRETAIGGAWLSRVPAKLSMFSGVWDAELFAAIRWDALVDGWSDVLSTALVVALTLMLTVSALEVDSSVDADINRELRAAGLAGIASGLSGGVIGTPGFVPSRLLRQAGSSTRAGGVVAGLVVAAVALLVPGILEWLPNTVTGGTLIYVGSRNLRSWVVLPFRTLPPVEWAMVLVIGGVTFQFGTVQGIIVGVLAACIAFAARAAAMPVIAHRYRGDAADSFVERSEAARERLRGALSCVLVLHLQGALFFGTISRLSKAVLGELVRGDTEFMILDLSAATELDSTGAVTIGRLLQRVEQRGVRVLLAAVPEAVANRLPALSGMPPFPGVAEALAWCEERLLGRLPDDDEGAPFRDRLLAELGGGPAAEHLLATMLPVEAAFGDVVIEQGESSDHLFFVERGHLAVELALDNGRSLRVRTIGPGAMVGEVGFYMGLPRTAVVRAEEGGARLLMLTRVALEDLQRREPDAAMRVHALIAGRLSHRVVDMSRFTAALARSGPVV